MRKIKYLIFVCGFFILISCQKKSPTETSPVNNTHPQVDIPWPSLADSPWPIAHGNMQCTGRSQFQGPEQGIIKWEFSGENQALRENNGSAVIGEDGTIYFTTSHKLYALNPDNSVKWKIESDNFFSNSPMVGREDIIYIGTGKEDTGCYYAIDNQGEIIWEFNTPERLHSYADAIGLDGTIFFAGSQGTLYALSPEGTLKWQTKGNNGFYRSLAISPDGMFIYVGGLDSTLNAVETQTSALSWSYFRGASFKYVAHMIDNEGNIYSYAKENEKYNIVCLDPSGKERWKFINEVMYDFNPRCDMHMDKDGNIYFCTNTKFCSLNYLGNLRFSVPFNSQSPIGPIVGDKNGHIYFGFDYLLSYDQNGNKIFECYLIRPLILGAISDDKQLYLGAEPRFYCIK